MKKTLTTVLLLLAAVRAFSLGGTLGQLYQPQHESLMVACWDGTYGASIPSGTLKLLDLTGNGHTVTGAGSSPTLAANAQAGWQNVRFVTASSQYATFTSINLGNTVEVFVVAFATNQNNEKFLGGGISGTNRQVGFSSTSNLLWFDGTTSITPTNVFNGTNKAHLYEFSGSAGTMSFYFDGTNFTGASGTAGSSMNVALLGQILNAGFYGGDMSAVCITSAPLPASRRNLLYNGYGGRLNLPFRP